MQKLHIENKIFELPESMNEMTRKQLIFLAHLVAADVPIQDVKVKILFFCLEARVRRMKVPHYWRVSVQGQIYGFTSEEVVEMSQAFNFLFTEPDANGNCFLDDRLTYPPIDFIRSGRRKLFLPGEALTECTYNQYIYLQTFDVMKESNPEAIYNFLACMFRERDKPFNPDNLHTRAVCKLTKEQIILILWYWIGSCRYIADKFPRIFPAADAGSSGNPYDGQQRLLDYMTKADAAKKEEYKRMKLYDVLYSLDYMLETEEKKNL